MNSLLLAQEEAAFIAIVLVFALFYVAVLVLIVASYWKILTKAGEDGWKALVPFLNGWTYAEIVGRPGWWGLLLFVPLVNIVFAIILSIDLAKSFGKDPAFAVGLILLGPVFHGILAFGSDRYIGPAGPDGRPGWNGPNAYHNQGYGAPQGGYQAPAGQQWGQVPQQPQQWQDPQWQQAQQPQWQQPQPPDGQGGPGY